jgi:hypothetical protein
VAWGASRHCTGPHLRRWTQSSPRCSTADPARGDLIKGGGGIRKMRFAVSGRGKSGGVRVIYYWAKPRDRIYLLLIYPKSRRDDLTDRKTAILRDYVKEL